MLEDFLAQFVLELGANPPPRHDRWMGLKQYEPGTELKTSKETTNYNKEEGEDGECAFKKKCKKIE